MEFNFTREQIIRAIVIITAITFVLSSMGIWFKSGNNAPSGITQSQNENIEQNITMGVGNVELIIDSYSAVIRLGKVNNETQKYLQQMQADGTALYVDASNPARITVALSDPEDTYYVAKHIINLDPSVHMELEAFVHSDEEFEFSTQQGTIKAKIPASKITLTNPYEIGDSIAFKALVQFVDGKIVGAKLTPTARKATVELKVLPTKLHNKYYVRMFFYWHDRVGVDESKDALNNTLAELGARNVIMNYIRDDTVYASRSLTSKESKALREKMPGVKTVQFNKVVFYSNYTYTEDEIADALSSITNNSVEVSFSPPMLELLFLYDGNASNITEAVNSFSYAPISKEMYVLADVSLGGEDVEIDGKTYAVNEMNKTAYVPIGSELNMPTYAKFDVSIVGKRIVNAEQNLRPDI